MRPFHFSPLVVVPLLALLAGCASPPQPASETDWHAVMLPGKPGTLYTATTKDGRPAVVAVAERSASMWRRRVALPAGELREVNFSWWVPAPVAGAHVGDSDKEDAAARVMFAFDGDVAALPARTRMLFDLAEALTGEQPPYATLMYVWDSRASVGSVIVNPRTDRVRKIVVDSGYDMTGRWRDHTRDIAADFRRAFGEEPGALRSIALMTDGDNTGTKARAYYGPVTLACQVRPPAADAAPPLAAPAAQNSASVVRSAHTACKP